MFQRIEQFFALGIFLVQCTEFVWNFGNFPGISWRLWDGCDELIDGLLVPDENQTAIETIMMNQNQFILNFQI
jgi:hypothetical protein